MPDDVLNATSKKSDYPCTHISNSINSTEDRFLLPSVMYPSPPNGEADVYFSQETSDNMQSSNLSAVKLCEQCLHSGKHVGLKPFQINHEDAIYLCPEDNCQFPLMEDDLDPFIIRRDLKELQKNKEKQKQEEEAKPTFTNIMEFNPDEPHLSNYQTIDYSNKIFDSEIKSKLMSVENILSKKLETCTVTPSGQNLKLEINSHDMSDFIPNNVSVKPDIFARNDCLEPDVLKPCNVNNPPENNSYSFPSPVEECNDVQPMDCLTLHSTIRNVSPTFAREDYLPSLSSVPRCQIMLQWKNERNLCWLDVLLHCFVSNAYVRKILNYKLRCEQRNGNIFCRLCKIYDNVQEESNDLLNGCLNKEEAVSHVISAVGRLDTIRTEIFDILQKKFDLTPERHESVIEMFPNMLSIGSHLRSIFTVQLRWEFKCRNCRFKMVRRSSTEIISFLSINVDFHPLHATFSRPCPDCFADNQTMNMIMEMVPPCLMMHFQHGLPHNHFKVWDFGIQEHLYSITAVVQYITEPLNHFVVWIRDSKKNKWMCCNDLENVACKWKRQSPKIPPDQIHMIMWEKQGIKNLVPSDEEKSNCLDDLEPIANHHAMLSSDEFPPETNRDHNLETIVVDDDDDDDDENVSETMSSESLRDIVDKTPPESTVRKTQTRLPNNHKDFDEVIVDASANSTKSKSKEQENSTRLGSEKIDSLLQTPIVYANARRNSKDNTLRMAISNASIDFTNINNNVSPKEMSDLTVQESKKRPIGTAGIPCKAKRMKTRSSTVDENNILKTVKCESRSGSSSSSKRVTRSSSRNLIENKRRNDAIRQKLRNRSKWLSGRSNGSFMKNEIKMLKQVREELKSLGSDIVKTYKDNQSQTDVFDCLDSAPRNTEPIPVQLTKAASTLSTECSSSSSAMSINNSPIPPISKGPQNPMSNVNTVEFRNLSSSHSRTSVKLLTGAGMFDSYKPKRAYKLAGYKKAKLKSKTSNVLVQDPYCKPIVTEQHSTPPPFESYEKSSEMSDASGSLLRGSSKSCSDSSISSASRGNATSDYSSFLGSHFVTPNSTPTRNTDDDVRLELPLDDFSQKTDWSAALSDLSNSISNTPSSTNMEDLVDDLASDYNFMDNITIGTLGSTVSSCELRSCKNPPLLNTRISCSDEELQLFSMLDV